MWLRTSVYVVETVHDTHERGLHSKVQLRLGQQSASVCKMRGTRGKDLNGGLRGLVELQEAWT